MRQSSTNWVSHSSETSLTREKRTTPAPSLRPGTGSQILRPAMRVIIRFVKLQYRLTTLNLLRLFSDRSINGLLDHQFCLDIDDIVNPHSSEKDRPPTGTAQLQQCPSISTGSLTSWPPVMFSRHTNNRTFFRAR